MTGDQNVLGGGGSSLLGGGGGLNLGGLGGGQPQQFGGAGTSLLGGGGGGTSALGGLGGAPIGGGGGMLMGGLGGQGQPARQPQTEAEKIEALMPLIVKLTDPDQVRFVRSLAWVSFGPPFTLRVGIPMCYVATRRAGK